MQNSLAQSGSDMKCIWMLAGIINYKLCDRNFDCEKCNFNKVMQGEQLFDKSEVELPKDSSEAENKKIDDATAQLINKYLYALFSDCNIHLDRYYHSSNFWYRVESDNIVSVGIDKLFIKIIAPVDRLILPAINKTYYKNQMIALIVRKGRALPLISPVKGTVVGINEIFLQNSFDKAIDFDEYMFKMEEKEIDHQVRQMCNNVAGLQCFSKKVKLVRNYLAQTFEQVHQHGLGTTLADGGIYQTELEKIIGETAFQELLARLLSGKKKIGSGVNSF